MMTFKKICYIFTLVITIVNCKNVSTASNSKKETQTQKPNILLICIDDLRPELNAFGKNYIISPNLDQLSQKSTIYTNHFVNSPSCGPSRYTLLTGVYGPPQNNALFQRAKKINDNAGDVNMSMPEYFRSQGYTTVSVGKVSHHPGGRGGKNWDDNSKIEMPNAWDKHLMPTGVWQHPKGAMHGLANGKTRKIAKNTPVFESKVGVDTIYPDGLIAEKSMEELQVLSKNNEKPFFLAVGIIKPHLPFGAPKKYYDLYNEVDIPAVENPNKPKGKTTWHGSGEFMKYNRWGKNPNKDSVFAYEVKRHYAACVTYADAQIGKILNKLKETGADKNTIVVVWGDHGWHLGEHGIWGKHSLFEESLKAPLIIYNPKNQNQERKVASVVETIDIFPTLCDLTGLKIPEFAQGKTLENNLISENSSAVAYTKNVKTIRTQKFRLTLHADGFVELYDHTSTEKETKNIAEENPMVVSKLKTQLERKFN